MEDVGRLSAHYARLDIEQLAFRLVGIRDLGEGGVGERETFDADVGEGDAALTGNRILHGLIVPAAAAQMTERAEPASQPVVGDCVLQCLVGQELDVGAEIAACFAHKVGEPVEGVRTVLLVVADDDQRQPAADELVAAQVLVVAAVGEVPVPVGDAVEACQPLVQQGELSGEECPDGGPQGLQA